MERVDELKDEKAAVVVVVVVIYREVVEARCMRATSRHHSMMFATGPVRLYCRMKLIERTEAIELTVDWCVMKRLTAGRWDESAAKEVRILVLEKDR